MMLLKFV